MEILVCLVLGFYLICIIGVIGLLVCKIVERRRESKKEREEFKKYKDY